MHTILLASLVLGFGVPMHDADTALGSEGSADSTVVHVHAAVDEAREGWTRVEAEAQPHGNAPLWVSPDAVTVRPEAWEQLTFRIENGQPVLTGVPGAAQQEELRALLQGHQAPHLVVVMDDRVRYAAQVFSIHGAARSIKLFGLMPDEAAQLVAGWHQTHQEAAEE